MPTSALGHKRTNGRGPNSSFVHYCPKADKILALQRQDKLVLLFNRGVGPCKTKKRTPLAIFEIALQSASDARGT
jgi:hypothetical protein